MNDLYPYDWESASASWWAKWRQFIDQAYDNAPNEGYCRAALLAQAYYVMNLALERQHA